MRIRDIEARIQALVEVHLMNLLQGRRSETTIVHKLASTMHSNLHNQEDGSILAPNIYVIVTHPSSLNVWREKPGLLDELGKALHIVGNEAGYKFTSSPIVTTAVDTSIKHGDFNVLASFKTESISTTQGVAVQKRTESSPETIPSNAFMILDGTKVIPLNQTVINIGRRLDNQIVIDDPRVSRNHAQLRVIRGRFMLFDLNSTGGTFVNNQKITQSILYPGDVVSLAGVTLIFGQDIPTGRLRSDRTQPNPLVTGDRPTVFFPREKE